MSLTKQWGTNKSKEKDGVWVDVGFNDADETTSRIRVRRCGPSNKEFQKTYARLGKKLRLMRGDKEKLEQKAFLQAFCETCVIGWEFIENLHKQVTGEPPKETYMPFSVDNAVMLFKQIDDLAQFVIGESQKLENFQGDEELGKS